MSFVDDKTLNRNKQDAVTRARLAREERAAREQQAMANQRAEAETAAALRLQHAARHICLVGQVRTLMRSEWDAAFAATQAPRTAAQQMALATWLLRFASGPDSGRIRALCGVIISGLDQDQAALGFGSAGLSSPVRWVATTRRLILAVVRLLSPTEVAASGLLAEVIGSRAGRSSSGSSAQTTAQAANEAKKRLSAHFSPLILTLLRLGEPEKWKLVQQLASVPAGVAASQALIFTARSAMIAAATPLVSALGALVSAVHASADATLLGAAIAAASLPLQGSMPPPSDAVRLLTLPLVLTYGSRSYLSFLPLVLSYGSRSYHALTPWLLILPSSRPYAAAHLVLSDPCRCAPSCWVACSACLP